MHLIWESRLHTVSFLLITRLSSALCLSVNQITCKNAFCAVGTRRLWESCALSTTMYYIIQPPPPIIMTNEPQILQLYEALGLAVTSSTPLMKHEKNLSEHSTNRKQE